MPALTMACVPSCYVIEPAAFPFRQLRTSSVSATFELTAGSASSSVLAGKHRRQQLLCGVLQHAAKFGLRWNHADEVLGLFKRDVGRQRRHVRIGIGFKDDRPIGGERFVPGGSDPVRVVDEDALEPD